MRTGQHDLFSSSNSIPLLNSIGQHNSAAPTGDNAVEQLRRQNRSPKQLLLDDGGHQRKIQKQQQQLLLLHEATERVLHLAAAAPVVLLDRLLPSLQRQLLYAAAEAAKEKQAAASVLLQRLTQSLSRLNSRSSSGSKPKDPNESSSSSSSNGAADREGGSVGQRRDDRYSSNSNDNGNREPRNQGPAAPGGSSRRVPLGFEAFYPKEASKKADTSSGGASSVNASSSGTSSGRLPFMPPSGGALQHLLLRICIWLGFWIFALSLLSRVAEPQLSLQEFLSSYVARGLVEKVVVPQQQAFQSQAVLQDHQQLQQPKLSDILPKKHIVRFRTGLAPESFIEKMEHFQASLGIHPKDFLPIYVEEGWSLSLGDLIASTFFLLIIATIARDLLMGGAINRGGSASGLNRLLGSSSSKRARIKPDTVKVRFSDVAGLHEAKREIMEFVAFLKNPTSFHKMGAKLPKGALLVGPPGTGKTLLAKAVAGEAGVPFFSISGSDFVELFVGVGASRVRELFDEARKAAPSIIWIDEIDSVGASRSTQFANSEREQTLNQLLVEMDGFSPQQSVVVLAGTNREDLLDAALKRAGRFDRRVMINRPDVKERAEIFKVHLQPLKLSPRVDADALAERMAALTPGMVGADIANVCNEAAIYAARRRSKRGIEQRDFEMAVERTLAGLPSNTKSLMSDKQRKTIALHEAGHAVAGWFLKHADVVLKLTIIPRDSGAMGFSQQMPPPVELYEKEALLDRIAVCLAGRAAEELFMECISSGAVDDIEKATHLARLIVMQLGMNPKVGLVNLKRSRQNPQDPFQPFSDATAQLVDDEVRNLIAEQYERVKQLLKERETEMRALSTVLLEKESLTFADLQDCLGPRPFPPDPQLAAYVNALPTRALLAPSEGDNSTGDNSQEVDATQNSAADASSDASAAAPGAGGSGGSGKSKKTSPAATSTGGSQQEDEEREEDSPQKDASDSDDDKDDDDDNSQGPPRGGPKRKKLFGRGDDDSCVPELLRKNLQPKTPAPSAVARGADLGSTP
ncbi:afg3 ATPase family [Cyclospora cayetanensis]|uniref:Afg3 ATPase family n=1 Tax=Cyclospora cayetanensis TaxID=88456 RepID=A0A1D3CWR4_9EIME|nr:afg3 ATPase family [Cyclospora cayetanensis]